MTERMIRGRKDTALDIVVYTIMILFAVIFLYPLVFVLSNSISSSDAVLRREVWLWPVGFSLESYRLVFRHQYVLQSYLNSFLYTGLGTAYSVALTILGAYPLSRRYLPFRDFFMLLIAFTMMFSGGLIPTYLLVRDHGLLNKVWAMVLPCAVTPFNLILLRTSMQEIPGAIEESAKIDGAGDFTILVRIILPMCFASVATITLLYVMAKWNDWFNAMIYLNDHSKYPLQMILRDILITNEDKTLNQAMLRDSRNSITPLGFKCAIMVISIIPLAIIYPFVQRFFVKGIMVGAVKG